MPILQASFFWQSNLPEGMSLTFGAPIFAPTLLEAVFEGTAVKTYMRESDLALGTGVVRDYLAQLAAVRRENRNGAQISVNEAILVALNIMWLSSRGFIPSDEYNGVQFISHLPVVEPRRTSPS